MNITVISAGSWGTAFAIHCAKLGHCVNLVPRDMERALQMASDNENPFYLPGCPFPSGLSVIQEVAPALMEAELLVLACPTQAIRETCAGLKPHAPATLKGILTLSKGLEKETLEFPFQVIEAHFPDTAVGVLSGPNYAKEIAKGLPAASVISFEAAHEPLLIDLQKALHGNNLRIYRSTDRLGVQLGGVLKNVYAMGAGLCVGLKLGDNALASYLTRALNEMIRIGTHLGGKSETFYGLSGLGDFMATSYGAWSRNHQFGAAFAETQSIEGAFSKTKGVVEGYLTIAALEKKLQGSSIATPILHTLKSVFYDALNVKTALQALQDRPLIQE
jgi:glycerol-3-phosphate dehydrogenase (NAD(P)+)